MEVSGQIHDPAALTPRKAPPVPVRQEAGRVPEAVWTLRRREKSLLIGNRTAWASDCSPSLYGLNYGTVIIRLSVLNVLITVY
jgi:hypothetical protein